MLSNILDEALTAAIPDEIRMPSDMSQIAYVNLAIIDDPSKKCILCKSTFKDYEGKILKCGACKILYHEFCLEQQLARDGTCANCGNLMIYEKYRDTLDAASAPQYFQPPSPTSEPEKRKTEGAPPPPPE